MVYGSQAATGAFLIALAWAVPLAAQPFTFQVRHRHFHGSGSGTLEITAEGIAFQEPKKEKHSRTWKLDDIQQLELSPTRLRILTYEDNRWRLGRDREFEFDRLPKDAAAKLYPLLQAKLDRRFVAAMPESDGTPLWQVPVKLLHGWGGSEGELLMSEDRIVYRTKEDDASRTWRIQDIDEVSSSQPYELIVIAWERFAWHHGAPREFRFQLKEPLGEARYNELWQRVQRAHGLRDIDASPAVASRAQNLR